MPKSHDDNRKLVCIICVGKAERLLSENLKDMITIKVFSGFLENEHVLPVGIYGNCRLVIQSLNTSQPRSLKRINYEKIMTDSKNLPLLSRQNPLCSCIICQAGKQKFNSIASAQELKNPIGRPRDNH